MVTSSPVPVTLDRDSGVPLGRQLAAGVRDQVVAGTLPVGRRLPSTRALATDLGVSRSVAEHAYDQLSAEGWLESRRGSGTYVAAGAASPRPRHRPSRPRAHDSGLVRLDTGTPWLTPWIDPRHRAAWRRAWREVSAATPPPGYDDPAGLPELRDELAGHLARTRGLTCDPDEILKAILNRDNHILVRFRIDNLARRGLARPSLRTCLGHCPPIALRQAHR